MEIYFCRKYRVEGLKNIKSFQKNFTFNGIIHPELTVTALIWEVDFYLQKNPEQNTFTIILLNPKNIKSLKNVAKTKSC